MKVKLKKVLLTAVFMAITACVGTETNTKQVEKATQIKEEKVLGEIEISKITEYGAKIKFETTKDTVAYLNGIKIDEVPRKEHYYYITGMEPGTEKKFEIKVGNEIKNIGIKTKTESIDYSQHPKKLDERVFYEIFVRAFADSDGDGIGDFNGITENLDYLEYLGINGIWLMPINRSTNYHGYDVTNYYELNPEYGTEDDLKKLLAEAKKRDIKIIMDLVINHSAMRHPYFQSARRGENEAYRDWYSWSDTHKGTGWEPNAADDKYYYAIFWSEMPDLNYDNHLVVSEMKNVADYWLDFGLDGFRFDDKK